MLRRNGRAKSPCSLDSRGVVTGWTHPSTPVLTDGVPEMSVHPLSLQGQEEGRSGKKLATLQASSIAYHQRDGKLGSLPAKVR